jgi:hypothetical protein
MRPVILSALFSISLFAALPATTVIEVRPTHGSDSYGGCFDSAKAGTDYSQQNSAQYNFTDLATSNGTANPAVVSSASHSFVSADVGNCIHISAGTNWTVGWYEIVSVSGGNATLDRAAGSSVGSLSGGTWYEGGALATMVQANTIAVAGAITWVKAESTITTSSTITLNQAASNAGQEPAFMGYSSTRGDQGQVTITTTTTSVGPLVSVNSQGMTFANFIINCNSESGSNGVQMATSPERLFNILVENCQQQYGIEMNSTEQTCSLCTVKSQGGGNSFLLQNGYNQFCFICVAVNGSVAAFSIASGAVCDICIAANNSGASSDGFVLTAVSQAVFACVRCLAVSNGRDGFRLALGQWVGFTFVDSIAYGNSGYGMNNTTSYNPTGMLWWDYNAYGSNTSGNLNNLSSGAHDKTLALNPFVNSASNNFALSAAGITALGGNGFPGALPVGGTGYLDIGPIQHQSTGGGQKGFPIVQ